MSGENGDKKLFIWTFVVLFVWIICVSFMLFVKFGYKPIEVDETIEPAKEIVIKTVEVLRYTTEKENIEHREEEVEALCKVVWGEARGCSTTEQAAVVWCVLNRVEDERFPNDIISVLEQPGQFNGYSSSPYFIDGQIYVLVVDVFNRWSIEQESLGSVGRVLPKEYMWFYGNGKQNVFRDSYNGNYNIWDWSLESPYKED